MFTTLVVTVWFCVVRVESGRGRADFALGLSHHCLGRFKHGPIGEGTPGISGPTMST